MRKRDSGLVALREAGFEFGDPRLELDQLLAGVGEHLALDLELVACDRSSLLKAPPSMALAFFSMSRTGLLAASSERRAPISSRMRGVLMMAWIPDCRGVEV